MFAIACVISPFLGRLWTIQVQGSCFSIMETPFWCMARAPLKMCLTDWSEIDNLGKHCTVPPGEWVEHCLAFKGSPPIVLPLLLPECCPALHCSLIPTFEFSGRPLSCCLRDWSLKLCLSLQFPMSLGSAWNCFLLLSAEPSQFWITVLCHNNW